MREVLSKKSVVGCSRQGVRRESNPGKKGRVESPSRLAPSPASTPQSQSFVKKGGLLLILSPALERPDKESLDWEMCYMEVFLIVDVLTHDPLIEIYDPPWASSCY